jgi:glutamyl-tRNA synthetase
VRTALFNWIYAKSQGGHFILRVEDTDRARSTPESEVDILEGLTWLGITWDEFYRQTDRIGIYREYLRKLLNDGKAYYCFCSKEDLEAEKQALMAQGFPPKYSGRCRSLSKEEVTKRLDENKEHVIRFKVPEKVVVFHDLIRGEVKFDAALGGDIIIAKDLDQPLYNFAVVVDDALMDITHVIRGEEHLSNTPKQIMLAEALEMNVPQFAHLPLILNTDRSKMSKRMSDVALHDYRNKGYLPQTIVNFISFLGWHPKEDKDLMTLEEIASEFDISRVQKGGAVFDKDKLDWLNSQYINRLSPEELIEAAEPFIPKEWDLTPSMASSLKGRIKTLAEIPEVLDIFFKLPEYETELLRWKDMQFPQIALNLESAATVLNKIDGNAYDRANLEKVLAPLAPEGNRGELFWPLRVALSGRKNSPGPFEIMEALGKEESLTRIDKAIAKAKEHVQ